MEGSTKIAAPNGAERKVAAPGRLMQQRSSGIDELAREALGTPEKGHEGEVSIATQDRLISVDELRSVWGLRPDQLEGLSALGVVWKDGLDEAELKTIAEYRTEVKDMFKKLFGKNVPDMVFDQIWKLVLTGKLVEDSWNNLMKPYGFKMNSESFRVLLGGENGGNFVDDKKVEGIAEFKQALESLILTMEFRLKPTGEEETDAKQVLDYPVYMKRYCKATNFNVFSIDKAEGTLLQVLEKIAEKYKLNIKLMSKDELLGRIQAGELGDHLQKLAKDVNDWTSFLVALLRYLEEAVAKGISQKDTDDGTGAQLERSKRMGYIKDILSGSRQADAPALGREIERLFNGEKPDFDYALVRRGGE